MQRSFTSLTLENTMIATDRRLLGYSSRPTVLCQLRDVLRIQGPTLMQSYRVSQHFYQINVSFFHVFLYLSSAIVSY